MYVLLKFSSATPCMFVRSMYLVMAAQADILRKQKQRPFWA